MELAFIIDKSVNDYCARFIDIQFILAMNNKYNKLKEIKLTKHHSF